MPRWPDGYVKKTVTVERRDPVVLNEETGRSRQVFNESPIESQKPEEEKISYDLLVGIRSHRTGRWKGHNLWELVKIDSEGKRTVLIDASDRRSIINYVVRQIGKIVVYSGANP